MGKVWSDNTKVLGRLHAAELRRSCRPDAVMKRATTMCLGARFRDHASSSPQETRCRASSGKMCFESTFAPTQSPDVYFDELPKGQPEEGEACEGRQERGQRCKLRKKCEAAGKAGK
jgi:hypothetical protein